MARGGNPASFGDLGGDGRQQGCNGGAAATPLAQLVMERCGIPSNGVVGHPMPGYDIRSQDALSIFRLSMLAMSNGSDFYEVYCKGDGMPTVVKIGSGSAGGGTTISESKGVEVQERLDHIVVKAKENLPIRFCRNGINVMGGGVGSFSIAGSCIFGKDTKSVVLGSEAYAMFQSSPNCPDIQEKLCQLVKKSHHESLLGYKMTLGNVPRHCSISPSQQTPYNVIFPPMSMGSISVGLGTGYDCEGGISDISNVNIIGAPIIDIARGSDLLSSPYGSLLAKDPFFGSEDDDFYILLDDQCGLSALSRGQNWSLFGDIDQGMAQVTVYPGSVSAFAEKAINGVTGKSPRVFRRKISAVSSIMEAIQLSVSNGSEPFGGIGNDILTEDGGFGTMLAGFGGYGFECYGMVISLTLMRPCYHIRSMYNDAASVAASFSSEGAFYHPIIIKEEQNPIIVDGQPVEFPVASDDCGTGGIGSYCPDTILDTMEGTVIDFGAPWASKSEAAVLSNALKNTINGDSGDRSSVSFLGVEDVLPGVMYGGGVVNFVEIVYADKDSITTNITTGSKYYQTGSYSDSKYVKHSETASRRGRVVGGSSSTGLFTVDVDGFGVMSAMNGILEPIFPGDRVEVKIYNVPIEVA